MPSIINVQIQYAYGKRIKNRENHKIYFIAQKKAGHDALPLCLIGSQYFF